MAEFVLILIIGGASVGPIVFPLISFKIQKKIKKMRRKRKMKKYIKKIKVIEKISEEICVICQEDFEKKDKCVKLHCNHYFHKHCIEKWICIKEFCPLCNTQLKLK